MRPNIFLGTCEGSTQYKKWYFEVMVDHVEPFLTAQPYHLRVGWALTEGYSPYPGGGEGWGGNGVGDDLYSYGFDGLHLWSGKVHMLLKVIFFFLMHLTNTGTIASFLNLDNVFQRTYTFILLFMFPFFYEFDLVLLCPYHIYMLHR